MITGALRRPPSLLPWILFGVTAGILAALTVVLIRQASSESQRADEAAQANANTTARAEKAELALTQLRTKVEPLEKQIEALAGERDELSQRVKTLETAAKEGAAAPASAVKPAPAPAKPPAKKIAKKKATKKKKRR